MPETLAREESHQLPAQNDRTEQTAERCGTSHDLVETPYDQGAHTHLTQLMVEAIAGEPAEDIRREEHDDRGVRYLEKDDPTGVGIADPPVEPAPHGQLLAAR